MYEIVLAGAKLTQTSPTSQSRERELEQEFYEIHGSRLFAFFARIKSAWGRARTDTERLSLVRHPAE